MKKFVIFIKNFFCIFRERRYNNQYAGRQVPSQAPLPSLPPSQGQSEPPYTKCLCKSQMKSAFYHCCAILWSHNVSVFLSFNF